MRGSTNYLFLGVLPTAHPDEPWACPFCPAGLVRPFRNEKTFLPSEVDTFRSRQTSGYLGLGLPEEMSVGGFQEGHLGK